MRRAVIDIGTNSVLLLAVDISGSGSLSVMTDEAVITRLGEDFERSGKICRRAVDRTIRALINYLKRCEQLQVDEVYLIGTAIFRQSENSIEVQGKILEAAGYPVRVISKEEEASLSFRSVLSADAQPVELFLVVDIGGGSTELAYGGRKETHVLESLPLGAVTLTERFLKHDLPEMNELQNMHSFIREQLETLPPIRGTTRTIGTGGTITTLAAVFSQLPQFDSRIIDGMHLARSDVKSLFMQFCRTPVKSRRKLKGIEQGREDIITAGAGILLNIMDFLDLENIEVSVRGIRYGYIMDPR